MEIKIIDDYSADVFLKSMDEVDDFCNIYVRSVSRPFYRQQIKDKLTEGKIGFVDYHAGNKRQFNVYLK